MITVTVSRDGRTWYGCQLYRVRLEGATGNVTHFGLRGKEAREWTADILGQLVLEGRGFRLVDDR